MKDMFDNMYKVQIANSGDAAGFPRSHDGLEKAITLAFSEGTSVTLDDEVIWAASDDVVKDNFKFVWLLHLIVIYCFCYER